MTFWVKGSAYILNLGGGFSGKGPSCHLVKRFSAMAFNQKKNCIE